MRAVPCRTKSSARSRVELAARFVSCIAAVLERCIEYRGRRKVNQDGEWNELGDTELE